MFAGGDGTGGGGGEGPATSPRGGVRATPQTLATPARRSSDWRPARQSLAYGESDYQSLDRSRRSAWPRVGACPHPNPRSRRCPSKPTTRQLSYLRSLANRTGQTFTYPKTRQQASAEIDRLKHTRPSSRTEVRIERKLIADQIAAGPVDAARVRENEISGHGSHRHLEGALMTTPTVTELVRNGNRVGQRVELARYTIPAGERVLYGQRVDGVVRVTDRPASGRRPRLPRRARTRAGRQRSATSTRARLRRASTAPRRDPHARSPQPLPCARRGVSVERPVQPEHRSAGRPRPRSAPADQRPPGPGQLRRDRHGRARAAVRLPRRSGRREVRARVRPAPAEMAHRIATELDRNEIWD